MRTTLRPLIAVVLSVMALATALTTYVCDLSLRIGDFVRETLTSPLGFGPRQSWHLQPAHRISMEATALNDRLVGGVRVRGFLGVPTVRMLTG